MDAREFIQQQVAQAHDLCDGAMQDVTVEQFNWVPPGLANTVSATFMHIVGGEDMFIHTVLQGRPRLLDNAEWASKIGIESPGPGRGWEEFRTRTLPLEPVRAYEQAVRADTESYLATLTAADLDRKLNFAGRERTVGGVLVMLVGHILSHAGEIAALKGVQGCKGLPF